jgi:hypothetical protein
VEEKEEDETIGESERGGVGSEGCRQAGGGGYINRKEGDETTDRWELGREGRTPPLQPVGGHRLTGAEPRCSAGQECVCVRGVVSDGRAGRQVADAVGGGLGTAGYGDTRPHGSPLTPPPTDPSVRWSLACCRYGRGWAHKKKKKIRDEKNLWGLGGGWLCV